MKNAGLIFFLSGPSQGNKISQIDMFMVGIKSVHMIETTRNIWLLLRCSNFARVGPDQQWYIEFLSRLYFYNSPSPDRIDSKRVDAALKVINYFSPYIPFPQRPNVASLSQFYFYLHGKCFQ